MHVCTRFDTWGGKNRTGTIRTIAQPSRLFRGHRLSHRTHRIPTPVVHHDWTSAKKNPRYVSKKTSIMKLGTLGLRDSHFAMCTFSKLHHPYPLLPEWVCIIQNYQLNLGANGTSDSFLSQTQTHEWSLNSRRINLKSVQICGDRDVQYYISVLYKPEWTEKMILVSMRALTYGSRALLTVHKAHRELPDPNNALGKEPYSNHFVLTGEPPRSHPSLRDWAVIYQCTQPKFDRLDWNDQVKSKRTGNGTFSWQAECVGIKTTIRNDVLEHILVLWIRGITSKVEITFGSY